MVKSHTPVNMACESSWSSKTTAKQQRNRIKEKAQLVMHVTREDHRESSPARRWKYIIIETMKNIKTHLVMGERGKTMLRWRRLKCSYTVGLHTAIFLSLHLHDVGGESNIFWIFLTRHRFLWWILISVLLPNESNQPLVDNLIPKKFSWPFFSMFLLALRWNSQTNHLFILM